MMPGSSRVPLARFIGPLLAALSLVAAGCASTPKTPPPPLRVSAPDPGVLITPRTEENLRLFDTVWNQINREYYDPEFNGVDWSASAVTFAPQAATAHSESELYEVFNRMLAELNDKHAGALRPHQAREFTRQQATGIGLRLARIQDQWMVTSVLPASPAFAAGIRPGWRLISRDGKPPAQSLREPAEAGRMIQWVFEDLADQRIELELAPQIISTVHREARILPGDVAYLRFDSFDFELVAWLKQGLADFRDSRALVLDLRYNSGGAALAAHYAMGHFLDRSQVVIVTVDRAESRRRWVPFGKEERRFHGDLVVLVSPQSGSASELLAAVLQEQGRATIVGQQTPGAVLGARPFALPDGGILLYSVEDLLTARGVRLEGVGVRPDIVTPFPPTLEDLRNGRDATLDRALELLRL